MRAVSRGHEGAPTDCMLAARRFALGCALGLFWSVPSRAQAPGAAGEPPADAGVNSAPTAAYPSPEAAALTPEKLIEDGIAQRKAGDDRAALDSFRRAHELGGSPRALAQLALAEQALGRWLDADEHLTRALERDHDWIREHSVELRAALELIRSELGSLEVTCNVEGAEVYVDGRRLGVTPSPSAFRVVAGQSVIQVVAEGYFNLTRQVQVEAGGLARVEVSLTPRSSANDAPAALAEGTAAAAKSPVASPDPSEPGVAPWRDGLMYGSMGLSAVGLATGIAGYAMREVNVKIYNDDSRCDLNPLEPRSEECPDAAKAWRRGENLMIGGFVAAGVFGALALYLWIDRPAEDGAKLAVGLTPGGVTCSGTF